MFARLPVCLFVCVFACLCVCLPVCFFVVVFFFGRSFLRRLEEKATAATKSTGAVSSMASARAMFQAKAMRGQTSSSSAGKDLWTQHANAIVGIESMGNVGDATCSKLSTCGERRGSFFLSVSVFRSSYFGHHSLARAILLYSISEKRRRRSSRGYRATIEVALFG